MPDILKKPGVALAMAMAILFLVALTATAFQSCHCSGTPALIVTGIDAGPGERIIEDRLDARVQQLSVRIEQIEEKFSDDLAAFDAQQRAEYERLREGEDLEAAARMLSDWNRTRRSRQ